jgi:hypothetical protein
LFKNFINRTVVDDNAVGANVEFSETELIEYQNSAADDH